MLECQDTLTLFEYLQKAWAQKPKHLIPMKVSVTLLGLIHDSERTFSFFDSTKKQSLSKAMDAINAKFGKDTLYFAGTHTAKSSAPTRIAFQSVPEFDV